MKASVNALKAFPDFNSSLAPTKDVLIHKKYYNIGVAVDTPEGLVVPVVKDVDRKAAILKVGNFEIFRIRESAKV